MGKNIWWMLLVVLVLSSGCAQQPGETEVTLGEEITLAIGQRASIAGEGLDFEFIEVIGDSRCPTGAVCVWAGEASCLLEITDSGSAYRKVLTQPGLSGPARTDFQGYEITFDLQPYPRLGKEIKSEEYHLLLKVDKKSG